jgi:hypothetical protein
MLIAAMTWIPNRDNFWLCAHKSQRSPSKVEESPPHAPRWRFKSLEGEIDIAGYRCHAIASAIRIKVFELPA